MKHAGTLTPEQLKNIVFDTIDAENDSILRLSRYINNHPETAYRENKAAAALKDFLSVRGFDVTAPIGGLDTAFVADWSTACVDGDKSAESAEKNLVPVAIIAEYDALEGVGHGCGHNLIAAAAAAAGIGIAAAGEASRALGKSGGFAFSVIGTPAEEVLTGIAGKNRLIDAGIFRNVKACLMFHPWTQTGVARKDLGCTVFSMNFRGRPAHAAADPWNGLNALDAAVGFYNSISMLRQQLPAGFKLHCILPEGGSVLNVIPERARAEVVLRSTELEELQAVEVRIKACAEAAAAAAGCSVEIVHTAAVKPILFNQQLFELAASNTELLGETLNILPVWEASSDFGDLSREVPSISILYKTHESGINWHSKDVADASACTPANEGMIRAAKILAATAIDLILDN